MAGWWSFPACDLRTRQEVGHAYVRHSVGEVDEFIGWGRIEELSKLAISPRDKALPAALFETGCRVSEGIQLKKSHFDLTDSIWVTCVEIPIVKQKMGKKTRTFSFPRDEPLWKVVEAYLQGLPKDDSPLFPFTRLRAYQIVKELGRGIGLEIWAHWFRSQRASQMGSEYRLTENELMEWFKVKDPTWARRYCKLGDWGLKRVLAERKPDAWRL
jgi:integrase